MRLNDVLKSMEFVPLMDSTTITQYTSFIRIFHKSHSKIALRGFYLWYWVPNMLQKWLTNILITVAAIRLIAIYEKRYHALCAARQTFVVHSVNEKCVYITILFAPDSLAAKSRGRLLKPAIAVKTILNKSKIELSFGGEICIGEIYFPILNPEILISMKYTVAEIHCHRVSSPDLKKLIFHQENKLF